MTAQPVAIHDPRAIPVVGIDHHLPAVDDQRLSPEALLARFAQPPVWHPEFPGDGIRFQADRVPMPAAVLVALVPREDGLRVLLTRRADHLRDHAGQVSFPGGRTDPGDASAVATALREAYEEVGLQADDLQVVGQLPSYATVTSYIVTPVVAFLAPQAVLRFDPVEVAEAFEVPLSFLMNPAHHRRHVVPTDDQGRQFLSMPWQARGDDGQMREYFIWGATAAMLRNFYRFLSA